jgi:hypothetical protein
MEEATKIIAVEREWLTRLRPEQLGQKIFAGVQTLRHH